MSLVLAGMFGVGFLAACARAVPPEYHNNNCPEGDCPPPATQCHGSCVPYYGASWFTTLVQTRLMTDLAPLRCPASAPEEGMSGKVAAGAGKLPRRFIACSVTPLLTCSTAAEQPAPQPGAPIPPGSYFPVDYCAPDEPGYAHCILKPGDQDCSETDYPEPLPVLDEKGAPATICCEDGAAPPP